MVKEKGFTLIELLIVIGIIGILSGLLLVVINPGALLAKGRDARRLADLDSLNKAITLALTDGEITLTSTSGCTTCVSDGTRLSANGSAGWVKFTIPAGKTGLAKYLPTLPLDPLNTGTYLYKYASDGTFYELDAVMESPDNANKMSTDGGTDNAVYEIGTSLGIL